MRFRMSRRLFGLLAAATLVVAACSAAGAEEISTLSDNGQVASLDTTATTAAGSEATGEPDTETQLLAFAQCIRDEGFNIDDPTVDSSGNVQVPRPVNTTGEPGPPAGFTEAFDVCAEYLDGLTLGFQQGDATEREDQFLAFAACLRDNGYDVPDPDFSVGGGRGFLQDIDQNDPAFQAASAACSDILSSIGRGPGG